MSNTKNVVLVTGGTGMVGMAIKAVVESSERLQWVQNGDDEFFFASSKDADLTNLVSCDTLFARVKPTMVIHLAAQVGGLYGNLRRPADFYLNNSQINNNVVVCAHKYKVKKMVGCLSTCIFPDKTTYPIDETMLHSGPPHDSNFAYAYAKRMLHVMSQAYNMQYGCNFATVVPCNVYGPHDNFHLEDSHVAPGLMHKFYLANQKGTDMVIMGTGKPLRQFIYSLDLAKLFLWVLFNYKDVNVPVILATDEEDEVSIADVAQNIAKHMNFKGQLTFDTSKSDGQFKKTASNKKN